MRRVLQVRGQAEMQGARVDVEPSERCGEAGRHKLVVLKPVRGAVGVKSSLRVGGGLTYRFRVVDEGVVLVVAISDIYQVLNPILFLGFRTLQRQTTKFSLLVKLNKRLPFPVFSHISPPASSPEQQFHPFLSSPPPVCSGGLCLRYHCTKMWTAHD